MISQIHNYVSNETDASVHNDNNNILLQAIQAITVQYQNRERQLVNENMRLRNDNIDLQTKLNILENKQDEAVNEIQDLRQLVKRVYQEGEVEVKILRQRNQLLMAEKDGLVKSLVNIQDNIQVFAQLKGMSQASYWGEEEKQMPGQQKE